MERKRTRLHEFDYSTISGYFITVCTKNRRKLFGEILPGNQFELPYVMLSDCGKVVRDNIEQISSIYSQVQVDKYVIMPNHLHLLLQLRRARIACVPNDFDDRTKMLISKVVQSLKASVTRQIRHACNACPTEHTAPIWQAGFYDHVIRNDADYARIWKYIDENPVKWTLDEYYIHEESRI